jgi:hypothetical protein
MPSLSQKIIVLKLGDSTYTIVMELSCTEPKPSYVSKPNNRQKDTLKALIAKLRIINPALSVLCRKKEICSVDGGRLDSQSAVRNQARANLQFQIDDKTYGVVVLNTFPTEAPGDLKNKRIDDKEYGFPMEEIMDFIVEGLYHSSSTQTYTYINWRIHETKADKSKKNFLEELAAIMGLSVQAVAKLVEKVLSRSTTMVKLSFKIAAKTGKLSVKAIPFIGLGCAVVFGTWRYLEGDSLGALAEIGSGWVSLVPVVGITASIAIDAWIASYDISNGR